MGLGPLVAGSDPRPISPPPASPFVTAFVGAFTLAAVQSGYFCALLLLFLAQLIISQPSFLAWGIWVANQASPFVFLGLHPIIHQTSFTGLKEAILAILRHSTAKSQLPICTLAECFRGLFWQGGV